MSVNDNQDQMQIKLPKAEYVGGADLPKDVISKYHTWTTTELQVVLYHIAVYLFLKEYAYRAEMYLELDDNRTPEQ